MYEQATARQIDAAGTVRVVAGELSIWNTQLTELAAELTFPQLTRVGGEVSLKENRRLADASQAFPQLRAIGENLVLDRNERLASIAGCFSELVDVGGDLRLENSLMLQGLLGATVFPQLARVGGGVSIRLNQRFANISGAFPQLVEIGGDLTFENLAQLTDLDGVFPQLRHIGGTLRITRQTSMRTMQGAFPALESIDGSIVIASNNRLRNFARSFPTLYRVGGEFQVSANNQVGGSVFDRTALPALCCVGSGAGTQLPQGVPDLPTCSGDYTFGSGDGDSVGSGDELIGGPAYACAGTITVSPTVSPTLDPTGSPSTAAPWTAAPSTVAPTPSAPPTFGLVISVDEASYMGDCADQSTPIEDPVACTTVCAVGGSLGEWVQASVIAWGNRSQGLLCHCIDSTQWCFTHTGTSVRLPTEAPNAAPASSTPTGSPTVVPPGRCQHMRYGDAYPCYSQSKPRCDRLYQFCVWLDFEFTTSAPSVEPPASSTANKEEKGASSGFAVILGVMIAICVILLGVLLMMRQRRARRAKAIMQRRHISHPNIVHNATYDPDLEATRGIGTDRLRHGGTNRESNRDSSVYEDEVEASLDALEAQFVQVMKDEWMLNNPGINPDRDAYWLAKEAEIKLEFQERFLKAEDKRRTYHEEEEEDFEGFAAVGGYSDTGEPNPMESLEMALEQALEDAERAQRHADEVSGISNPSTCGTATPMSPEEDDDDPLAVSKECTAWYHGEITKKDSHELLLANAGHNVSGKFLLRDRPEYENEHILSVIYKGKVTHHLIKRDSRGKLLMLNNQACEEEVTSLEELVMYLREAHARWPVPLTEGVKGLRIRGTGVRPKKITVAVAVEPASDVLDTTRTSMFNETSFGPPKNAAASTPPSYASATAETPASLSTDPAASALWKELEGEPLKVEQAKRMVQTAAVIAAPTAASNGGDGTDSDDSDDAGYLQLDGKEENAVEEKPTEPKPPTWLHGDVSREESAKMVVDAANGDGTFLVRQTEESPEKYYLCVLFKNKPTHHLIQRNHDGFYVINNKDFGEHLFMSDLIEQLDHKQPKWPVGLVTPIACAAHSGVSREQSLAMAFMERQRTVDDGASEDDTSDEETDPTLPKAADDEVDDAVAVLDAAMDEAINDVDKAAAVAAATAAAPVRISQVPQADYADDESSDDESEEEGSPSGLAGPIVIPLAPLAAIAAASSPARSSTADAAVDYGETSSDDEDGYLQVTASAESDPEEDPPMSHQQMLQAKAQAQAKEDEERKASVAAKVAAATLRQEEERKARADREAADAVQLSAQALVDEEEQRATAERRAKLKQTAEAEATRVAAEQKRKAILAEASAAERKMKQELKAAAQDRTAPGVAANNETDLAGQRSRTATLWDPKSAEEQRRAALASKRAGGAAPQKNNRGITIVPGGDTEGYARESMHLGQRPSVKDRQAMFISDDNENRDSVRVSDLNFLLGDDGGVEALSAQSSTDPASPQTNSRSISLGGGAGGESSTDGGAVRVRTATLRRPQDKRPSMSLAGATGTGESSTDNKRPSISLTGPTAGGESSSDVVRRNKGLASRSADNRNSGSNTDGYMSIKPDSDRNSTASNRDSGQNLDGYITMSPNSNRNSTASDRNSGQNLDGYITMSPNNGGEDEEARVAQEQEKFRLKMQKDGAARAQRQGTKAPAETTTEEVKVYYGATDEIGSTVRQLKSQSAKRSGKYWDPAVQGPRESMAIGRRPSVSDMLRMRQANDAMHDDDGSDDSGSDI